MWINGLVIEDLIEEKIWQKHRVRRYEVEEVLTHRQAIRLRHKRDPVRMVVVGATHTGRLLKIILEFQGKERYFLVTAMELKGDWGDWGQEIGVRPEDGLISFPAIELL